MSSDCIQVYFLEGSVTYYPSNSLDKMFLNLNAVNQIVPGRGSDIWFWAAAIAAGTKQICLRLATKKDLYIPMPKIKSLPQRILPVII